MRCKDMLAGNAGNTSRWRQTQPTLPLCWTSARASGRITWPHRRFRFGTSSVKRESGVFTPFSWLLLSTPRARPQRHVRSRMRQPYCLPPCLLWAWLRGTNADVCWQEMSLQVPLLLLRYVPVVCTDSRTVRVFIAWIFQQLFIYSCSYFVYDVQDKQTCYVNNSQSRAF